MKVAIIDYGMGNLYSVEQALKRLGCEVVVSNDEAVLNASDALVLPGVGAFPDAMERLQASGLDRYVRETSKPLLGICLGMQLLFEGSAEVRPTEGLHIFKGRIARFENVPRIPHMGWNDLQYRAANEGKENYVYFVHSFYATNCAESELVAYAKYGDAIVPAIVARDNFTGMQFHPEKSGEVGMKLLQHWLEKVGAKVC